MKKIFFLCSLVFLLSSCKTIIPPPENTGIEIPSTSAPIIEPAIEPVKPEETGLPEKYSAYIKEHYGDNSDNFELLATEECDLDLDGNPEIVISVNDKTEIYILRDENGEISQVGGNINEDGKFSNFKNYEISFVKMQNSRSPYIYIRYQNFGMYIASFSLYQLVDNEILLIEDSNGGNATGEGDNELTDKDNDGYYDGCAVSRWSYDVYYYPTTEYYVWDSKANAFNFDYTFTDVGEYPTEVPELIHQYLALKCLYDGNKSKEVTQRLADMQFNTDSSFLENEVDYLYEFMAYNAPFPDSMELSVKGNDYSSDVYLTVKDDKGEFRHIKFTLINEGKWQISAVMTDVFMDYTEGFPDEIMKTFNAVNEFIEDKNGASFIIWTDDVLKDILFTRIGYIEDGESWTYVEKEMLYKTAEITPDKPLLLKTTLPEGVPNMVITFTDKNGKAQTYLMLESWGLDGSFRFSPVDIKK